MRAVAFTVDVDRDVNLVCQGQVCSISQPRGGDSSPRFSSSLSGLKALLEVLEEAGVPGTFFWEGRSAETLSRSLPLRDLMAGHEVAAHGYDHEDFPGAGSGIPLDREGVRAVLERTEEALKGAFGVRARGFRAPYQRTSRPLMDELVERGYLYDSSDTLRMVDGSVHPFRRGDGLMEAPVCWTLDRRGKKIVSYLWPYHEGKRPIEDYMDLLDGFQDGLLVLATHSWHLTESFCSGPHSEDEVRQGKEDLLGLLRHGLDTGARFVRLVDRMVELAER